MDVDLNFMNLISKLSLWSSVIFESYFLLCFFFNIKIVFNIQVSKVLIALLREFSFVASILHLLQLYNYFQVSIFDTKLLSFIVNWGHLCDVRKNWVHGSSTKCPFSNKTIKFSLLEPWSSDSTDYRWTHSIVIYFIQ